MRDALHGYGTPTPLADVDVIWFDKMRADPAEDRRIELQLHALVPDVAWSVKNLTRLASAGTIELCAPYGFDDLLGCILRPTPRLGADSAHVFRDRVTAKRWRQLWPCLTITLP